jgi:simple sugar transport system ATP-binding protein
MVHQHFMLIPVFTVTESVILGTEPTGRLGSLDWKAARQRVEELSERFGLAVDPDAKIEDLPVGVQQRVEILKALYRDARCLILDEPTAVLTPSEIDELMNIIRSLQEGGRSIIFITHKLREVLAVADKIVVLRGGRVVGHTTPAETDRNALAAMMVGHDVQLVVDKPAATPAGTVLRVTDLDVRDDRQQPAVRGVSLEAREGEILAIAGVQGNGQSELVEAITGLRRPEGGHVELDGTDVTGATPDQLFARRLAHVPEDRQHDGMVGPFSVADNLVLNMWRRPPFAKGLVIDREAVRTNAERQVVAFVVRTSSVDAAAVSLSGG